MAGHNRQAGKKWKVHHSDSKSCSSETRQTTNQEAPTKVTSQKSPITANTTSNSTANKLYASQSLDKASLTIVSQHKNHLMQPQNSISKTTHVLESPLDKNCVVKPTSNTDVAVDGPIHSTRSLLEPPGDKRTVNPERSAPSQSVSTLRHPLPPRPPPSNESFFAFGWNAYPTRATKNEVCIQFLRGACYSGGNCYRIHPRPRRPPSNLIIKVKLAESPRAPVYETPNSERYGVSDPPHSKPLDPVIVKLPRGPIPSRVSLPQEGTNQHTTNRSSSQTRTGYDAMPKGLALNDRFNERAPLNRSLVSKHSGQDQPETKLRSNSDQSSKSSVSDSTNSSPRIVSSQSSVAEGPQSHGPKIIRKRPPPPPHPEACRSWLRGYCPRGYRCLYVHDDIDYDPPVKGSHPPPPSSETCIKWLQDRCHFGYGCYFVHGDLEYSASKPLRIGGGTTQELTTKRPDQQPKRRRPPPVTQWSMSVDDHAKVTLGEGFEVKEVVTGFETPWVFIGGVPIHITSEEIKCLLDPFGPVVDIRLPSITFSSSMNVKVRLSTSDLATQASTTLNNSKAFGGTITARLPISNTPNTNVLFRDTAVRIQWEAPGKVGYGGYSNMEHASKALAAAGTPIRDNYVKACIHAGLPVVGAVTIKFRGVPIDANEGDMERFAHPDDVVWERPNYTSLPRAISGIKRILEDQIELISFDIIPPPYKGATVSAWAHFSTANDAQIARDRLHGRQFAFTGNTKVYARHVRSLGYSVAPALYDRVGADIENFQISVWRQNRTTTISILRRPDPQTTLVRLSSEDLKELGRLKSEFEKILNGEVLREAGKTAWDDFFAHPEGTAFLECIKESNPGVIVQLDTTRKILKLLGSVRNRDIVRRALLSKINWLRSQQVRTITLDGPLVGVIVISALNELRLKIGGGNVILDRWNRNLRIRGDDSKFEAAQEVVNLARERYQRGRRTHTISCPVCFDQVTAPITLSCGHVWCRSCLAGYLLSSIDNKYFPLTCLGDDAKCGERIPLSIAQIILPVRDLDAIVHAAFSSYVQTRPEEFHYCPSPDCPQIYRTAAGGTVLQCPSCLLRICPCCHVEAHDGFACPDADGGDNRFREWMKEHDVKNCPGCKIPIERAEGCNHVTCTQCQTHICWECLETFPKGQGIYDHMRSIHGGIGLAPIEF